MFVARLAIAFLIPLFSCPPLMAREPDPPAIVIADGETGGILYQRQATQPRHPASLAKLMTLYLAFEALRAKPTLEAEPIKVSRAAAMQTGSLLGLRPGESLTFAEALAAVAMRSANDAAVALAEHLEGSEAKFAQRMTERASALGMTGTRFRNATGLSAEDQVTTAADMLKLAQALRRDFPGRYDLFRQRAMRWKNRELPNLNAFLGAFAGAEGMKTGFTCPAGYNLVAAASRDGRRLIGVLLGAGSKEERESLMAANLNRAFKAAMASPEDSTAVRAARPPDLSLRVCPGGMVPGETSQAAIALPSGWGLELSFGRSAAKVRADLLAQQRKLGPAVAGGMPQLVRQPQGGEVKYRGLLVGLGEDQAVKTCLAFRAKGGDCLVLNPQVLKGAYEIQRQLSLFAARN